MSTFPRQKRYMSSSSQGSSSDTTGVGFDPAELIETHQAGVWRYLRSLGCERELANDITQETFLAVLEKPFDDYDPRATASYLRTVARNLFISAMRKAGRMVVVEDIDAVETTWNRWMGQDNGDELLDELRVCLEQLTERARWALQMRFRDRLPRIEIAENLGITEHGAKNLMQRAKQQLRACIETKIKD